MTVTSATLGKSLNLSISYVCNEGNSSTHLLVLLSGLKELIPIK